MQVSEKFTIEDIHNIRYENYEKTKHMSPQELIKKTNDSADKAIQKINELRAKRDKSNLIIKDAI